MKKKYNEMTKAELEKIQKDLIEDYRKIRFDFVLSSVDNTSKKRTLRKDIARLKTIIHEFDLGIRKA